MTHDKPDAKAPINNPASDPPGRNGDDEPNEEAYWDLSVRLQIVWDNLSCLRTEASSKMRIFSSAAWCFRVARQMLRTSVSDDLGVELDFCLIFAP